MTGRRRTATGGNSSNGAPAAVVIVDDHPMWRQTLGRVIEESGVGRVVAEAADGETGVDAVLAHNPDVAVVDINLPGLDGHATTRRLLESLPDLRVLVLSASDERSDVLEAMRAGAAGYLLKTALPGEVVDAIRRVRTGELVLPPQLADVVLEELRSPSRPAAARDLVVAVADPSALFREGVVRILQDAGMRVVVDVSDTRALIDGDAIRDASVVILDADLVSDGPDLIERIRTASPAAGLLLLCDEVDHRLASAVLERAIAGAGCLLKNRVRDGAHLVDAVCRVADGGSVVDPEVARELLARRNARDPLGDLTPRERDVLRLMAEGRSNQAICDQLFLSTKSVEAHVRNIFMKLSLEPAPDDHRRVLAVLTYLGAQ